MFLSSSIRANTINKEQNPALEIHIFPPVMLYVFPSAESTAFVFPELASLPAPGSVKQYAPNHSPEANLGTYFCFCSSVP